MFANQFKWAANDNIDPGSPGPFSLIFAKNSNGAPTIIFTWAPSNDIDRGGPGLLI